jgi:hypothetical protein
MKVNVLKQKNGEGAVVTTDVTPEILSSGQVIITQELERGAFQRVVDDFHIEGSDLTSVFNTIFAGIEPTDKIYLQVTHGGRGLFYGQVNSPSVERDNQNSSMMFDCFSATRTFWDAVQQLKVRRTDTPSYPTGYVWLEGLFNRELLSRHQLKSKNIIKEIDIREYTTRYIRDWILTGSAAVDAGMFRNIDPELTWADLLKAMAVYYNAEFWIDPDTNYLRMSPRNSILSATIRSLDGHVINPGFKTVYLDSEQIDYLYTFTKTLGKPDPIFGLTHNEGGIGMWHSGESCSLKYTWVFEQDGVEIESTPSDPIGFAIEDVQDDNDNWIWHGQINFWLPAAPTGVKRRKLYLSWQAVHGEIPGSSGGLYRLCEMYVDGNAQAMGILYIESPPSGTPAPTTVPPVSAWQRFTAAGGWDAPIPDYGNGVGAPGGKILDVRPQIKFTPLDDMTTVYAYNPVATFNFFNNDMTIDIMRTQYLDLFLPLMRAVFKVDLMDLRVGDGVSLMSIPGARRSENLLIKRAVVDAIAEETELTVYLL